MKRLTLYTKAGCTSCVKARQFLLSQGVAFSERDMFKHPLNEVELLAIVARQPLQALFSQRSPSAKELGLLDREVGEQELIAHMLKEPRLIRRPLEAIRTANRAGRTFVIVEHNMKVVMDLCTRIVVLENGRVIADGTPAEVQSNQRVLEAYFGVDQDDVELGKG